VATVDQQDARGNGPAPNEKGELDYLTVKGFRSIKSIEKLKLRPINVLVGANGSGKSNFVGVFAFLGSLRHGQLVAYTDAAGGAERILHFGSKVTQEIELEISFRDGENGYHVALSPTTEDRFRVHGERCWYWVKEKYPSPYYVSLRGSGGETGISMPQERTGEWVQSRLNSWRTYHFHDTSETSSMKKTCDVDDNRFFRADAANLSAFLYLLKQAYQSEYQLVRKTVQLVAPFFDDFHVEPLRLNPSKVKLEWIHKSTDAYFDASSLSDGTLRFICLSSRFVDLEADRERPSG